MPKNKLKDWEIADLVDLEFFLAQDADTDEAVLARRDRELYRERIAESVSGSRRELLRGWLDARRDGFRDKQQTPLPGDVVGSVCRMLPVLLFALGALMGTGLAWGVLSYSGDQPINLFAALILLVALPFSFVILSVVFPWLRLLRRGNYSTLLGSRVAGALLARLSRRLYGLAGGERAASEALAQSWGVLRGRSGLYSAVIGWQAYGLMQIAALGFSLFIFITVLFRGWIADLAFSWQTTARVSAEQVHRLVELIALPWSGLVDQTLSHPTVEQIAGSRVFLKEGLQHLSSADLQSWWYFLLWAILVYAVLPRLLLWGVALLGRHRAWRRMSFHDARIEALCRRMQHRQLHIGKEGEDTENDRAAETVLPEDLRQSLSRLSVLLPKELHIQSVAESEIQREFNGGADTLTAILLDEDEDAEVLQALSQDATQSAVLVVLEGWQPCITATLEYLKALRRVLGKERLLVVGLIGRQTEDGWSSTPDHDFQIWRRRLAALGDPLLLVHNWRGSGYE